MNKNTVVESVSNRERRFHLLGCVFVTLVGFAWLANGPVRAEVAEPRIQLEIAIDPRLPPMTLHEWAKALGAAGVEGVRVRTAYPNDAPKVQEVSSDSVPTYQVLAVVNAQNELVLPDARFSIRQIERFKQ